MARQRTSPYLSGIRSRLWRFVPTGAAGPVAVPAGDRPEAEPGDGAGTGAVAASAPVVALIRRLPLLFED
jgi:hypothetical protein